MTSLFLQHVSKVRTLTLNTPEYDDWLEELLTFDTTNIPEEYLWVDCHNYYLYLAPQGSEAWKKARQGRLTGSVTAEACQDGKYSNCEDQKYLNDSNAMIDPHIVAEEINGLRTKQFPAFAVKCMAHGTKTEPLIRDRHSKRVGRTILELPIAIPKYNMNIGVSIDGYLKYTDSIAEYKAPQKLYPSLDFRYQVYAAGHRPTDYNHILINHYYQMHLGMHIFGKKFCDYVVYDSIRTKSVYMEKIPFDVQLWEGVINPKIENFIEKYLKPIRPEGLPLMPKF